MTAHSIASRFDGGFWCQCGDFVGASSNRRLEQIAFWRHCRVSS